MRWLLSTGQQIAALRADMSIDPVRSARPFDHASRDISIFYIESAWNPARYSLVRRRRPLTVN